MADTALAATIGVSRQLADALARLTWVTSAYGWGTLVVPVIAAAPAYFAGSLSLGGLMMAVGAFNQLQLVRRLFPHVTPQVAEQIETRFRLVYDHTGWQLTRVYESAIETLSWLADHQVGCFLVTNKRQKPTRQILIKFGLLQFFIEVVSADTNGPTLESKEEMVSHLVEKHLLNPGRTLVVGDTHSDEAAARMCGMHFALAVYGYGSGYTDREWQEAHILHSISDLVQIVSAPT